MSALRDDGLSAFERQTLERAVTTGAIAQADYDEAFRRFGVCMADAGRPVALTRIAHGVLRLGNPPLQDAADLERYVGQLAACTDGTIGRIDGLFRVQQANPDLVADSSLPAIRCLIEAGAVDGSYGGADFERDVRGGFLQASFDAMAPAANDCLYLAGYSVTIDR